MKLKYYLRGLGTGILFATIVLFISYSYKMSDSQIKKKAEELGMIYPESSQETTLGNDDETTGQQGETDGEASTESPQTSSQQESSSEVEDTSTTEPTSSTETPSENESESTTEASSETESSTANEPTSAAESCELTVTGSTTSYDVAYALFNAGIIDDAEEFDDYLVNNGYARRIQNGTYTITDNMSFEEIANLITTRR